MGWSGLSKAFRGSNLTDRRSTAAESPAYSSLEKDYGLHTLVPRDGIGPERVDIVAIHGLNGHYLTTWTDPVTGVNWLRDIIPKFIPTARVMSFWYNSTVQFSKSTSDILTFADQLLENLIAHRKTLEEMDRSIAFLKTLESEKYRQLGHKIHGVIFFGTPHGGSELASWASTMGRILKAASLGTSTNLRLTRDLEPRSRLMSYISASFLERRGKLQITSCYETLKMDFLNCAVQQVVSEDSAVLGIASENRIPLDGDHRSICRFSSVDSGQFGPVKARLKDMILSVKPSVSQAEKDNFIESLGKPNYAAYKNRNPPAVEGTCIWILKHPAYRSWITAKRSALLWVSANPGCGKSVLASFLVDQISGVSDNADDFNVCYFFFKSDNSEQSDAVKAVKALLCQLYKQQPVLLTHGMALLKGKSLDSLDFLWRALMMSTACEEAKETICILDGLDECDPSLRRLLTEQIAGSFGGVEVQSETKTRLSTINGRSGRGTGEVSKIKVLITSRPENQIKMIFEPISKRAGGDGVSLLPPTLGCSIIRLRGEDETEAISTDITRVVKTKVDDLIRKGLPREILKTVEVELISKADRTFLWVSLILNLLELKVEAGASRRDLDGILKTQEIYPVYSELLAFCAGSPQARKMLQIVLAALRPLTMEELSIALAVEPEIEEPRLGRLNFDDIEYDLVYPFENHIKSLCGHFIRIIRNKIYLIHDTARDFLLQESAKPGWDKTTFQRRTRSNPKSVHEMSTDDLQKSQNTTNPASLLSHSRANTLVAASEEMETIQCSFQHSFSLVEAHALILKLCGAFLYCLGRNSRCANIGHPSEKTMPFLDYVAKSWAGHFRHVVSDGAQLNMAYYQNLCHPLFPGFECWTKAYWFPDMPQRLLGSPDEEQDFYLQRMGLLSDQSEGAEYALELLQPFEKQTEYAGDDGIFSDEERERLADQRRYHAQTGEFGLGNGYDEQEWTKKTDEFSLEMLMTRKAGPITRPVSKSHHCFPLKVDEHGFVSLDFSKSPGVTGRQRNR